MPIVISGAVASAMTLVRIAFGIYSAWRHTSPCPGAPSSASRSRSSSTSRGTRSPGTTASTLPQRCTPRLLVHDRPSRVHDRAALPSVHPDAPLRPVDRLLQVDLRVPSRRGRSSSSRSTASSELTSSTVPTTRCTTFSPTAWAT